ncbi:hypothetical protein LSAT2_029826 [Lamellibrachia satsuma]|nr:hypothetical protein LSAT2_029826 [Lamellibrachia satsuma]
MTTVVGWTALPANSTSYTFAHINLQESSAYYVELQVTNGADLMRSTISRPVLLDLAPLTVGSVKHGDNFRAGIAYQNSTTDMHGVLLYLPSSTRAACPQRTYSMSSPDQNWTPLVHKYLRGLQNVKQDGVIFQDFMLSYSSAGLGVTLRRDVKAAQMLSGAIQIDSDIEKGGTYLFNIQAAGGSLRAVTSVVFFDGPKGVFADYTPVLFDGDAARPADSGLRSNGMKVISRDLPGDTSSQIPEVELQERRAFGFQIYPSASYKGKSSNWMVLWSSKSNKSSHTIIELDFDPAATSHAYKLTVNEDEDMVDEVNWELKLYVDDKQRVLLAGTTSVSSHTQLTLGVYNRHGWVAPLEDVFYPPETTAHFQNLRFPPASSELCRFGDPFRGGAHPVVEFLAAVGTSADADDILTYQKIAHPCIPCQHTCDEFICSESCNADETQVIHFNISGLALEPQQMVMNGNETELQTYYLTVKAVAGSGCSVQASSAGVYIDTTPPVIQMIYHVDLSWSSSEPSSFQGGNTSMAVYYEAVDKESEVIETWWAIGCSPGGTDVQPFVNIGTESFVSNTSLEGLLFENHTYYVTLMCVNGAGLTTTNSSEGQIHLACRDWYKLLMKH